MKQGKSNPNKVIRHRIFESPVYQIEPVTSVMVSDPWYEKDVWCRYEKQNLKFTSAKMYAYDEMVMYGDHPIWDKTVELVLYNEHVDQPATKENDFEICVDTAKFDIAINGKSETLHTHSDGTYGMVNEKMVGNDISELHITIFVPEFMMKASVILMFGQMLNVSFRFEQVEEQSQTEEAQLHDQELKEQEM